MSEAIQHFVVLDKYPFSLLPGEPRQIGEDLSYYQYMLDSRYRAQTGKNILCELFCLEGTPEGLVWEEPFGGCGAMAVAFQETFKPKLHRITEIDAECVAQLRYALAKYPTVQITHGDARQTMGVEPADVVIMEIPFFNIRRYYANEWTNEIKRALKLGPQKVVVTDAARFFYHMAWKSYVKFDDRITEDHETYIYAMSRLFYKDTGYSITRCGWHGACYYYTLEPVKPYKVEFRHFGSGTGSIGIKKVNG